jgi:hypothetical protein
MKLAGAINRPVRIMILAIKILACAAVALFMTFGAVWIFHISSHDTTSLLDTIRYGISNLFPSDLAILAMLYFFLGVLTFDILSIAFFHYGWDQNREIEFNDGVESTIGKIISTKRKLLLYPVELFLFFVMLIAFVNSVFHQTSK